MNIRIDCSNNWTTDNEGSISKSVILGEIRKRIFLFEKDMAAEVPYSVITDEDGTEDFFPNLSHLKPAVAASVLRDLEYFIIHYNENK